MAEWVSSGRVDPAVWRFRYLRLGGSISCMDIWTFGQRSLESSRPGTHLSHRPSTADILPLALDGVSLLPPTVSSPRLPYCTCFPDPARKTPRLWHMISNSQKWPRHHLHTSRSSPARHCPSRDLLALPESCPSPTLDCPSLSAHSQELFRCCIIGHTCIAAVVELCIFCSERNLFWRIVSLVTLVQLIGTHLPFLLLSLELLYTVFQLSLLFLRSS